MAQLFVTLPNGKQNTYMLRERPMVAGREETCDIVLDDRSVSRKHARFTPTSQGVCVEDMDSKNGVLVNGESCTSRVLQNGDRVTLGEALLVFADGLSESAASVVITDDAKTTHATRYLSREKRLLLPQRRLELIYELSARLTTLQNRDALLEDAMRICFETLSFERGAIGVRGPKQKSLDWPVVRNLRGIGGELTISRTLLNRALLHGERATFTEEDSRNTDPTVSIVQQGIRSAMCVPLTYGDEILGVVYGDRISTSAAYTNEDVDFLAGIAQQVSIGLMNCRLLDEQRQLVRLEHDIAVARQIQTGLLPKLLPSRADFKVGALNEPGQRVSGDYYDVIERPDGRVWLIVADVTGEGIAAAFLMANLQAAVRVTIEEADDPAVVIRRWNSLICGNTGAAKFITCLAALVDPKARSIRYASAGHYAPLLVHPADSTVSELPDQHAGFPLGVEPNAQYESDTVPLGGGTNVLFCYTDGVIEAMRGNGEMFGKQRLTELIATHQTLAPQDMARQVRKAVSQFADGAPQSDDITIVVARLE